MDSAPLMDRSKSFELFSFCNMVRWCARMLVAGWWVVWFSRFVPFLELVALGLLSSESGNQAIYWLLWGQFGFCFLYYDREANCVGIVYSACARVVWGWFPMTGGVL